MEEVEYWVWISKIKNLGSIKAQRRLEIYKHPKKIWNEKKEDLLKIEGIATTNAGKNKKVVTMDGQYLSGFGPRVGDAVVELHNKLQ